MRLRIEGGGGERRKRDARLGGIRSGMPFEKKDLRPGRSSKELFLRILSDEKGRDEN